MLNPPPPLALSVSPWLPLKKRKERRDAEMVVVGKKVASLSLCLFYFS